MQEYGPPLLDAGLRRLGCTMSGISPKWSSKARETAFCKDTHNTVGSGWTGIRTIYVSKRTECTGIWQVHTFSKGNALAPIEGWDKQSQPLVATRRIFDPGLECPEKNPG